MKRIGYMCPRTYRFRVRVGAYCIRPTNVFGRKRMPPPCTYHFRPRSRMPQPHAYHFHPRVGAYCIRPTTVFDRKRTPCICIIHFRIYAGSIRFCVIRFRTHETLMWFCTYSPHPGASVGRMQYAPTRGRKWYARDCGVRDRGRKWYVQGDGVHDWTQKCYV